VRFILTADSKVKVRRSTVVLMFIQSVDEMVYKYVHRRHTYKAYI
jgi:hypothetical protein